jgi:hypothetical protein
MVRHGSLLDELGGDAAPPPALSLTEVCHAIPTGSESIDETDAATIAHAKG